MSFMRNSLHRIIFCIVGFGLSFLRLHGEASRVSFNEGWKFAKLVSGTDRAAVDWSMARTVHLPHTWNEEDAFFTDAKMYKGKGVYKKVWTCKPNANRNFYLHFEGVFQKAEVFFNGKSVCVH